MRDSYLRYLTKIIKEAKFRTLFKQFYKAIAIPASYALKRSFCGPVHGVFVVNYECNQRCKMCNLYNRSAKYLGRGIKKLTTEQMLKVIDDFADIGTSGIGFTGGEPILRSDIYELIKQAKKRGLFTHMSSNGMAINSEVARKLIDSGLDAIGFSLDGARQATHDFIRGVPGSFEKVINAIKSCRKVKDELKSEFIIISLCVINNRNLDEIIELIDVALNAGADKVSFSPVHDIGLMENGNSALNDSGMGITDFEKADRTIDRIIEIKKKRGIIDSSETYLGLFKMAFRNQRLPMSCYAGYATIAVDGYGQIYPCYPWMEISRSVANVRDISLKKFWSSKALTKMRQETKSCRNCFWNNQTELNIAFSLGGIFKS